MSSKLVRSQIAGTAATFAVFTITALIVYGPALRGPFVSDDLHYVATNPYVHALSAESLRQIFDPSGPASIFVVNYTPVHLLLHAIAWSLFGPQVLGHHVLNVVLHAAGATLLALVFRASGLGRLACLAGGAIFLLHPANVEAVAWISQLKSTSCLALSLAALLVFPSSPALATPLFFLALLAKPTASFLLPVVTTLIWVRLWRERPPIRHLIWLGVWTAGFLILAVAQVVVNRRSGTPELLPPADDLARLLSVAAIALRYVVMSATSLGVSTFHEPERALGFSSPWALAALPVLALLAARAAWSALRRREEAVYWVWAAAALAPVSQIFPFLYPMADRYLYFIFPGLLGAALLVLRDAFPAERARRTGLVIAAAMCVVFAIRSHARAAIWANPSLILADAARNYPEGVSANLLRAKRAGQEGDVERAVAALRAAQARGFNRFEQLESDPAYAGVRSDPRFRAVVRDLAAGWIAHYERLEEPTQMELRVRALAHLARGERQDAIAALEAALARGGPIDDRVRSELEQLRGAAR